MKYAEIEFGFFDTTAKDDGSFSSNDGKSFVDLTQLDNDNTSVDYYMDNQWNYTILDGTYNALGTEEYGFVSNAMSDEDGDFTINPVITREYNNNHTTRGLGFLFSEEGCPKQVKLTYYNGSTQLAQYTENVNDNLYFVEHEVQDYDKWTIELIGTKIPYRNAQLIEVYYGVYISWSKDEIANCNIIEEIDLASNEMPIKQLNFEVKDLTGKFNILNPDGLYSSLQEEQPLWVSEYIDGTKVEMGTFYLETWESTTGNIAKFVAHDILGKLDKEQFLQEDRYQLRTFESVLLEIIGSDIEYDLDSEMQSEVVWGYLPICTKREALQELCFSSRCYCVSGRDNKLHFRRLNTTDTAKTIGKSVSADMQTELGDLINRVEVYAGTITSMPPEKIWGYYEFPMDYDKDTYVVNYEKPATQTELKIETGYEQYFEVLSKSLYGMVIGVEYIDYPRNAWITGAVMETEDVVLYVAEDSNALIKYSVEIKDFNLIEYHNAQNVADYLYNIYQMRISQTFKLLLSNEQVGDRVSVAVGDYTKTGRITKLDIDLANGFIANAKVVSEV